MKKSISFKNIIIPIIIICAVFGLIFGIYKYTSGSYIVAVYLEEGIDQNMVLTQIKNVTGGKILPKLFPEEYFSVEMPKWKNFKKTHIAPNTLEELKQIFGVKEVRYPAPVQGYQPQQK